MQLDCKINLKIKKFHQHIINITKPIEQLTFRVVLYFCISKNQKKGCVYECKKKRFKTNSKSKLF